jgi:creatinine amidohydrolase
LGLPLDAEEIVGSALLRLAGARLDSHVRPLVLPPLRGGPAPYASGFFGIDPDTAHDQVREAAASVKASGFAKLLFFVTSPWQMEFVDVASCDARAELGLQTFVVSLGRIGLDFHPASSCRAHAQAVALHLLGTEPAAAYRPAEIRHADFRPGYFAQPAPLAADPTLDGAHLLQAAARQFAGLLGEIAARPPLSGNHPTGETPAPNPSIGGADPAIASPRWSREIFPTAYRAHYLPAFTRDALELTDKTEALAILPIGAIEQHGHHLPVGVDALLGQISLARALDALPVEVSKRMFVAPPLFLGKSNEHSGFAGTLTLTAKTLRRLVLAAATQLRALGFRRLAIFNTHGGNSAVLVYTLREIQTTLGLDAGMLRLSPGMKYFSPENPLSPHETEFGFHAGEWETALMLAATPELVRMEKAVCEFPMEPDHPGALRPQNAPAIFSWITADLSRSGVMGDATRATAENGRLWFEGAARALARRLTELLPAKN